MTDVDYDGFDWGSSPEAFRWNSGRQRFKDLPSFAEAVGIERHGLRVRKEEDFANWPTKLSMKCLNLKVLVRTVLDGYVLPWDGIQGVGHWARVLQNGLMFRFQALTITSTS